MLSAEERRKKRDAPLMVSVRERTRWGLLPDGEAIKVISSSEIVSQASSRDSAWEEKFLTILVDYEAAPAAQIKDICRNHHVSFTTFCRFCPGQFPGIWSEYKRLAEEHKRTGQQKAAALNRARGEARRKAQEGMVAPMTPASTVPAPTVPASTAPAPMTPTQERDPRDLLRQLLDWLPANSTWSGTERSRWLQAFTAVLDFSIQTVGD